MKNIFVGFINLIVLGVALSAHYMLRTVARSGINPALFGVYGFGAAVTPELGHGTAVTFDSGFLGNLISVGWDGIERSSTETTTLGDTAGGKTFLPGDMYDPGELPFTIQFDSDDAPPILADPETVTLTFPDAETWAASGFMTSFSIDEISSEGVITASGSIKFSGDITF